MKRIKPIDGLRACSALGVIWIHSWTFCGNPGLHIFLFDFYKLVAIAGNGVDFFFVISGFCMYLMIDKNAFTINTYMHFLYKRFLRIAPAFFASVIVYATLIKINNPDFPFWYNVFFHFLFLNNIVTGNTISGPFWSIGVEWHFYMVLPIVIVLSNRFSIIKTVILFSVISILFFCFANLGYANAGWWENQVVTRFPEFGCGIIAASLFLKNKKIPQFLGGTTGLFIGFSVMYLGRLMMFTPLLVKAGNFAFIFKAISYTVMTTGFAFIMFHVITVHSLLAKILSSKILTYLGKISYSIYLWHSLSFLILSKYLSKLKLVTLHVFIVFISISILTIIIAHFSYKFLESFYFKKTNNLYKKPASAYASCGR